jgi:hypothetical protein
MTGLHESTLALSVYNAIARCGQLSRAQLLTVLQKHWEASVAAEEIEAGIAYLLARKMVTEADGFVAAARTQSGAAATVIRDPMQQTELAYSRSQAKVKAGVQLDA